MKRKLPDMETIARKLRIGKCEPLHKLVAQLHTREGRVIDYSTSYFVPGYFHFHVNRRVVNHRGEEK